MACYRIKRKSTIKPEHAAPMLLHFITPPYPQQAKLVLEVGFCESDGGPTSDVGVFQLCHEVVHCLENRIHKL
jgi:hypothetical protein